MSRSLLREDVPNRVSLGIEQKAEYSPHIANWIRELRCGYLLSYAIDPTQHGEQRSQFKSKVCAGVLVDVRHKVKTVGLDVGAFEEDLIRELTLDAAGLAFSKSIDDYHDAVRPTRNGESVRYGADLRRLLTVGRLVEIAVVTVAAGRAVNRTQILDIFHNELQLSPVPTGSESPYRQDINEARKAWLQLDASAHIAAAFHTIFGPQGSDLTDNRWPFGELASEWTILFEYAEAYQEFLAGRPVSAKDKPIQLRRPLNKGRYWQIETDTAVAPLPMDRIKPLPTLKQEPLEI